MDKFTHEQLRQLASIAKRPCVSIYIPARGMGANARIDTTRAKNLLREAEQQVAASMPGADTTALLAPVRELAADHSFWSNSEEGLAIFVAPETFRMYRVPIALEESVTVGDRFDVVPLLPLGVEDGTFFLLAIAQNNVRLFRAGRQDFHELSLEPTVRSLTEYRRFVELRDEAQAHAGQAPMHGERTKRSTVFHGTGAVDDSNKRDLAEMFHAIDRELLHMEGAAGAPLVLAGVGYLRAMYRAESRHTHIVTDGIDGNIDHMEQKEMHARAWSCVEPLFSDRRQHALERLHTLAGTGRTSERTDEIATAAADGRIETLFIKARAEVNRNGPASPAGDNAAIAHIVCAAIAAGGTVYPVHAGELPEQTNVAAVMRY